MLFDPPLLDTDDLPPLMVAWGDTKLAHYERNGKAVPGMFVGTMNFIHHIDHIELQRRYPAEEIDPLFTFGGGWAEEYQKRIGTFTAASGVVNDPEMWSRLYTPLILDPGVRMCVAFYAHRSSDAHAEDFRWENHLPNLLIPKPAGATLAEEKNRTVYTFEIFVLPFPEVRRG